MFLVNSKLPKLGPKASSMYEFSVKIDGEYFDFRAKDPSAAAELIRQLTGLPGSTTVSNERETGDGDADDAVFGDIPKDGTLDAVLTSLRGTKTARFIKHLSSMEGYGGLDTVIKTELDSSGEISLAPFVASISKTCRRHKVDMSLILERKEKRVRPGKVRYHYRLTDRAAQFVESIAKYEQDEDFGSVSSNADESYSRPPSEERHTSTAKHTSGTNRSRVRAAASDKTISEMVELTELTKPQVRAAINSKEEKDRYERTLLPSGEMKYKYVGD